MLNREISKRTSWLILWGAGTVAVVAMGVVADLQSGSAPGILEVLGYVLVGAIISPLFAWAALWKAGFGRKKDKKSV